MHHNLNSPHRNYGQTNLLPWSANQNTIRSLCAWIRSHFNVKHIFCSTLHRQKLSTLSNLFHLPKTTTKKCSTNMTTTTTTTAAKKPIAFCLCLVYFVVDFRNLYDFRIANLVYLFNICVWIFLLSVYIVWLFVSVSVSVYVFFVSLFLVNICI